MADTLETLTKKVDSAVGKYKEQVLAQLSQATDALHNAQTTAQSTVAKAETAVKAEAVKAQSWFSQNKTAVVVVAVVVVVLLAVASGHLSVPTVK